MSINFFAARERLHDELSREDQACLWEYVDEMLWQIPVWLVQSMLQRMGVSIDEFQQDEIQVNMKPPSINTARKGRQWKTKAATQFSREFHARLSPHKKPYLPADEAPLKLSLKFGFSSPLCDLDNPVKQVQDGICNWLGIDDRRIHQLVISKEIVNKGKEFIRFQIEDLS